MEIALAPPVTFKNACPKPTTGSAIFVPPKTQLFSPDASGLFPMVESEELTYDQEAGRSGP